VAFGRWAHALARSLTEVDEGSVTSTLGRPLLGRVTRLDRTSPRVAAVLAKEQRYLVRHPRYRVQVVSQGMVLLVGGAPFLSAVIERNPDAVLLGCVPGLTAGVTASNLLGSDGRGLWAETLALPTLRPLLRGRSIAFVLLGIGLSVPLTFGIAAFTGGWQLVPPALGASVGMSLAGAGIGAYASTLAPTPFPDDANPNPFAGSSPGGGCLNGIATFSGVVVGLVAAAPILYGLSATQESRLTGWIVCFAAPVYGAAVWLLVTRAAGRRVDRRIPELLLALSVG
jgi:ABC-2 type transport system permease protein